MVSKRKKSEIEFPEDSLKLPLPVFTIDIPIKWKRMANGERVIVETGPAEIVVDGSDVEALLKKYEKLGTAIYREQLPKSKQRSKRPSDKSSNPAVLENGGSKT